jgi:hypothetical protein
MAAWGGSCPLEGVCSECGLTFAWRDVLNPKFGDLPGFFEHDHRRLGSFVRTWWRARSPRRFWCWVRLENRIVPRRIAAMATIGALQTHLVLGAVVFVMYAAVLLAGPMIPAWGAIYGGPFADNWRNLGLNAAWPLGHESKMYVLRFNRSFGLFVRPLELVAIVSAACAPLTFLLLRQSLQRARVRRGHIIRVWAYGLVWLPVALHLSGLLSGALWLIDTVLTALWYRPGLTRWRLRELDPAITLSAAFLWQLTWWSLACGRYLRLPHAWLIGVLMTVLAMLVSAVLVILTWRGSWADLWL